MSYNNPMQRIVFLALLLAPWTVQAASLFIDGGAGRADDDYGSAPGMFGLSVATDGRLFAEGSVGRWTSADPPTWAAASLGVRTQGQAYIEASAGVATYDGYEEQFGDHSHGVYALRACYEQDRIIVRLAYRHMSDGAEYLYDIGPAPGITEYDVTTGQPVTYHVPRNTGEDFYTFGVGFRF